MYWTDLEIGTPPTKFRVHVDTGSHLLWINGKDCVGCPMVDEEHGVWRLCLAIPLCTAVSTWLIVFSPLPIAAGFMCYALCNLIIVLAFFWPIKIWVLCYALHNVIIGYLLVLLPSVFSVSWLVPNF